MQKQIGSIVITEKGNVVLLTALECQGDIQGDGRVPTYDFGIVLRGTTAEPLSGTKIPYPRSNSVRVIMHTSEALQKLESLGVDFRTLPEKPLADLTPLERIERLERSTK
jgi:hypothetical protein